MDRTSTGPSHGCGARQTVPPCSTHGPANTLGTSQRHRPTDHQFHAAVHTGLTAPLPVIEAFDPHRADHADPLRRHYLVGVFASEVDRRSAARNAVHPIGVAREPNRFALQRNPARRAHKVLSTASATVRSMCVSRAAAATVAAKSAGVHTGRTNGGVTRWSRHSKTGPGPASGPTRR